MPALAAETQGLAMNYTPDYASKLWLRENWKRQRRVERMASITVILCLVALIMWLGDK